MVVAEAVDAVLACQIRLLLPYFRKAKVVVAEVCWEMGLIMASEKRLGLCNVTPFGEAWSPPLVVCGDWVKLREDKSNRLH